MNFDKPIVVFSIDVDWASDEILQYALDLFAQNNLPVTVFATHKTNVLNKKNKNVEVAIHPNFFNNCNHERHIKDLLKIYSNAKGVRAHGLFEYSNLMNSYKKCGLEWDSSQLLYLCQHIKPYRHPSGLVRLPIFWEDDDYISLKPDWKIENLNLLEPGVKCFNFHPIHLYLNSYSKSQYELVKKSKFSLKIIKAAIYQRDDKGVLKFFEDLLSYIKLKNIPVRTVSSILKIF